MECEDKHSKILFLYIIFIASCLAQSVDQRSSLSTAKELLGLIYPVGQKLLAFISDPNSNASALRAIMRMVDHVVTTLMPTPELPYIPQNTWWGDGRPVNESIRPFRVQFSDQMINDLRTRILSRRNFTSPIEAANQQYGINSLLLAQMLDYWQSTYDFKGREAILNRFPQFVTNIQGLDIHYIHVKPADACKRTVTILLLHGFPLTLLEYNYVIDRLSSARKHADFAFEIVAADLPGFGYSQSTSKRGLNGYQVGVIMKNLMKRLGRKRFYIHAGDVGSWVSAAMAVLYPEDILGLHSNVAYSVLPQTLIKYALGQLHPPAVVEPELQDRMYPITKLLGFYWEHSGYFHIQVTRPDTIGIAVDASPTALAAWILPLMSFGSTGREANNYLFDGNLNRNYDLNDIMDSLTIYWDQSCMTTASRFYLEYIGWLDPVTRIVESTPIKVPVAAIKFHDELIYQPDSFIKDKYKNLVQSIYSPRGGHFAAFERPKELSESIWGSIPKFERFNAEKRRRRG